MTKKPKRKTAPAKMADMTLCNDHVCPVRLLCRRYLTKPDPQHQYYFAESPWDNEEMSCEYYWHRDEPDD